MGRRSRPKKLVKEQQEVLDNLINLVASTFSNLAIATDKPKKTKKARGDHRKKLTPYQGKKRCFGEFKCPECLQSWQSAYSWANIGQMCNKCKIMVYPFTQKPLHKAKSHIDPKKNHPEYLCGKCRSIGYSCTEFEERSKNNT